MSNWSMPAGTRHETLGITSADGVTVTAGNGSKGSYATIGTTGFAYSGFTVMTGQTSAGERMRFDIAINTGGSDQVIVEDFYIDLTLNGSTQTLRWFFPIRIPSGAVIKVRMQATFGITATYAIIGCAQDFPGMPGFSRCVSATDFSGNNPANSVTMTGTTPTAYTTVRATTAARIAGMYVNMSGITDFSRTASMLKVDIAIGAAASEVILFSVLASQRSAFAIENSGGFYIPCDIPAGSRISFRVTCSAAAADVIAVACMGLAA